MLLFSQKQTSVGSDDITEDQSVLNSQIFKNFKNL